MSKRPSRRDNEPGVPQIRRLEARDLPALSTIAPAPLPDLLQAVAAWVLLQRGLPLGCAALFAVPGLPGLGDLYGFISAEKRRQGWGSLLLEHVLAQGRDAGISQLSCRVTNLQSPTTRLLQQHGFQLEHHEISFQLTVPQRLRPQRPVPLPARFHWHRPPLAQAIPRFLALYDAAFRPHPWYQPYTAEEVLAEAASGDLLFVMEQDQPVGFAWLHQPDPTRGEIEPVGVDPAFQRLGLGRALVQQAVLDLVARGVRQVHIGAWGSNWGAVALYRALGFKDAGISYYLARPL